MALSQTRAAVEAARENDGIVQFGDNCDEVRVRFERSVTFEVTQLVRDHGFLISSFTTHDDRLELFA